MIMASRERMVRRPTASYLPQHMDGTDSVTKAVQDTRMRMSIADDQSRACGGKMGL